MQEPSRMERMVGELIALRMIVAQLVEQQGGADPLRQKLLDSLDAFEVQSDTTEGAERIKACGKNMLENFPGQMDENIA